MNVWRLEVLRLTRTGRLFALGAVFVAFGLLGPVLTAYLGQLLDLLGGSLGGATVTAPTPTVPAALAAFEKNAAQVGTIVVVVVAAAATSVDAVPQIGMFFRVREPSAARILLPRLALTTAAAAATCTLGVLAAWYETAVLIGPVPISALLAGSACLALFWLVAVTLTAAWAQVIRGVLGAVIAALCTLLLLPVLGLVPGLSRYLPTELTRATSAVAAGTDATDFLAPALLALALSAGFAGLGILVMSRREAAS